MAGSIDANSMVTMKKHFKYIAPTPPSQLIDCTNFVIDFPSRKFLNIGLDPKDSFHVKIIIITPSRHITMQHSFLKRIYALMGNILSFILDSPQKSKKVIFFEDESTLVTNMVYKGENMLVLESKIEDGCRILLNRVELIALQELDYCIFEAAVEKSILTRPMVLQQFDTICEYVEKEYNGKLPMYVYDMKRFVNNLNNTDISKNEPTAISFVKQIKLLACQQIVDRVKNNSSRAELKTFSTNGYTPLSQSSSSDDLPAKQRRQSPPMNYDENTQFPSLPETLNNELTIQKPQTNACSVMQEISTSYSPISPPSSLDEFLVFKPLASDVCEYSGINQDHAVRSTEANDVWGKYQLPASPVSFTKPSRLTQLNRR